MELMIDHGVDPARLLARDEALWRQAESGAGEVLRLWTTARPFVVLGYGGRAADEADLAACRRLDVPVLRRVSGGGTVLQLPGCLNYSLVLAVPDAGPLATLTGTNRFIMTRHAGLVAALAGRPVTVQGVTDLELEGRKISGNAQRRGRRALLFHGTFLVGADLDLVSAVLRMPPRMPDWRQGRRHTEFLANLGLPEEELRRTLARTWAARTPAIDRPDLEAAVDRLVAERYGSATWNYRS